MSEIQPVQNAAPGGQPQLIQFYIGKLEIKSCSVSLDDLKILVMKTCKTARKDRPTATTA